MEIHITDIIGIKRYIASFTRLYLKMIATCASMQVVQHDCSIVCRNTFVAGVRWCPEGEFTRFYNESQCQSPIKNIPPTKYSNARYLFNHVTFLYRNTRPPIIMFLGNFIKHLCLHYINLKFKYEHKVGMAVCTYINLVVGPLKKYWIYELRTLPPLKYDYLLWVA